jgi:hypothetical protein
MKQPHFLHVPASETGFGQNNLIFSILSSYFAFDRYIWAVLKKASLNIAKYLLLGIFLGFFCSITFFEHVHVVGGITIVHSHPFKSGPDGKPVHSHSSNGLVLIHGLNHFVATASTIGTWIFLLNFILYRWLTLYDHPYLPGRSSHPALRAPPVYSLF